MMKKYLLAMVLATFLMPAYAEVSIHNDQKYLADDQSIHIVGELQNDLEYTISQVSIKATLYSEDNEILDIKSVDSLVRTISPGMKAPFDIVIIDKKSKEMANYDLELTYQISAPKSQVIEITNSQLIRDKLNNLMISGTVTNKGEITANTVSIVATLYDISGNVVAVSKLHAEPDYLRSNDQTHFVVIVPDKTKSDSVRDYVLVAESEEYAAVPEFPIGSGLLLAGSVGAYVLITRVPNRFIASLVSVTDLK